MQQERIYIVYFHHKPHHAAGKNLYSIFLPQVAPCSRKEFIEYISTSQVPPCNRWIYIVYFYITSTTMQQDRIYISTPMRVHWWVLLYINTNEIIECYVNATQHLRILGQTRWEYICAHTHPHKVSATHTHTHTYRKLVRHKQMDIERKCVQLTHTDTERKWVLHTHTQRDIAMPTYPPLCLKH